MEMYRKLVAQMDAAQEEWAACEEDMSTFPQQDIPF